MFIKNIYIHFDTEIYIYIFIYLFILIIISLLKSKLNDFEYCTNTSTKDIIPKTIYCRRIV